LSTGFLPSALKNKGYPLINAEDNLYLSGLIYCALCNSGSAGWQSRYFCNFYKIT